MSDEERDKTIAAIKNANYFWVLVSILMGFLAHLSRGMRWNLMLEPMGYKPKIMNSYHTVMIGYLVNLALPRAGEVSRAVYMQQAEKVPFEKGFGSIVAERLIDALMLLLVMALAAFTLGDKYEKFKSITQGGDEGGIPLWVFVIGGMVILGILFFIFREKLIAKLKSMIGGFVEGLKTIYKMKKRIVFILHTLFIWIMYVGMFWICFYAIGYKEFSVGMIFSGFVAGALAMMASQGGIGFYQLWVAAVLIDIFDVNDVFANALASIIWVSQTLLVVVLGVISLLLINRSIKQNAAEVSQ